LVDVSLVGGHCNKWVLRFRATRLPPVFRQTNGRSNREQNEFWSPGSHAKGEEALPPFSPYNSPETVVDVREKYHINGGVRSMNVGSDSSPSGLETSIKLGV